MMMMMMMMKSLLTYFLDISLLADGRRIKT